MIKKTTVFGFFQFYFFVIIAGCSFRKKVLNFGKNTVSINCDYKGVKIILITDFGLHFFNTNLKKSSHKSVEIANFIRIIYMLVLSK